ncbi:hypothetical protein HanPI659440_Chr02g0081651 [Helianthus annuus]|nr:hypothetical protein HanPI659440_Chr02g0081651 [Helianthus annuus]
MWMILHQLMNSSYSKVPWVIGMGTYAVLVMLLKMSPRNIELIPPDTTTTTTIGRNARRNATNATRNTRNATTTSASASVSATILKPSNNGTTTTTCVSNATNGSTISMPT